MSSLHRNRTIETPMRSTRDRCAGRRGGMTLVELMIAMTIMVMVVGALGFLAKGVEQGFEYIESRDTVTQHARVALNRIETTVREAEANDLFPGMFIVSEDVAPWTFPDTLVVWSPKDDDPPADPDGLPLFKELVIFCPNPSKPNELVEITVRDDERSLSVDKSLWYLDVAAIKKSKYGKTTVLTSWMRSCPIQGVGAPVRRGAIRFVRRLCPPQSEWDAFHEGTQTWDNLTWLQGRQGFCQAWVRIELQLTPGGETQSAIPFLGSAARYFTSETP